MIYLTVDEKHIVTLLGKKKRATEILVNDDGELYWYGALGGWSDPEMEKMQERYTRAVQALLSRGILELTDDVVSALLMETNNVNGTNVTQCSGKRSGGKLIRLSTSALLNHSYE